MGEGNHSMSWPLQHEKAKTLVDYATMMRGGDEEKSCHQFGEVPLALTPLVKLISISSHSPLS